MIETNETLPREVELLAKALANIHGHVVIRRERSGLQMYMACPSCLQKDGKRELSKKHLSVNAERYFGLGRYATTYGTYPADMSALCMKETKPFSILELKSMVPIQQRGYPEAPIGLTKPSEGKCIIDDGRGNMIPDHPGDVVSILDLPQNHPAVMYLRGRNYDLKSLWNQFRCSFCVREAPEDGARNRYYRNLPFGFKDSPQNRIIFYADVDGIQKGWQARIIEHVADDLKYYLHPYDNQWYPIERKVDGKWKPDPDIMRGQKFEWNPSKYKTAFSAKRNDILMGWDAALERNRGLRERLVIVGEGPLDAGRFGPPGVPLLGKFLAPEQTRMILSNFTHVLFAQQNDKASAGLEREMCASFLGRITYASARPPEQLKDFGEMSTEDAWARVAPVLSKAMQLSWNPCV